ncbi:MAG TPA: hypothetical protein VF525_11965 [Pyrinomonadaceae bacterium]|jgi:hypothetical protein
MKAIFTKLLTLALVVGALAATTEAKPDCHPRGVNARERHQEQRIHQGVRSGELTRRETARLQAEQARIRVAEAFARRSGGTFTARERARIERAQNRASKDIYQQKHDHQDRN